MDAHHAMDNELRAYLTRIANLLQKKEYESEEGKSATKFSKFL